MLRVSWSHIGENAITFRTGKSRGQIEAIIPLCDGLREVLERIPKRATTISQIIIRCPGRSAASPRRSFGPSRGLG